MSSEKVLRKSKGSSSSASLASTDTDASLQLMIDASVVEKVEMNCNEDKSSVSVNVSSGRNSRIGKLLRVFTLKYLYKKYYYNHYKKNRKDILLHTMTIFLKSEYPIYFFTLLDILKLKSLFKYRLHYKREHVGHLGVRRYPPLNVIIETAKVAEFNFLFAYYIPTYLLLRSGMLLGIVPYDTSCGEKTIEETDPETGEKRQTEVNQPLTWWRLFKEVLIVSILSDIGFWLTHRALHLPRFYLKYHKKHHDFKYSLALAQHCMSYTEAVVLMLPTLVPPFVYWALFGKKAHVLTLWVGTFFSQFSTTLGHAGYNLPIFPEWLPFFQAQYHDYHHIDYTANFGAFFPFIEKLFGTYVKAGLEKDMKKVWENVRKNRKFIR